MRPSAVAFDIIGTTFPIEPLRVPLAMLGLPASALETWFAAGLRDAFALALTDRFRPFAEVLEAALDVLLAEQGLAPPAADRKAVIAGMQTLDARPQASAALATLDRAGVPAIALTNGSTGATEALLDRAELRDGFRHIVSVDDVRRSKPAAAVYAHAAEVAGVAPGALALVAAHAWDIQGAHAAALTTAYLDADRPFSAAMQGPDVAAPTLTGCVDGLLAL